MVLLFCSFFSTVFVNVFSLGFIFQMVLRFFQLLFEWFLKVFYVFFFGFFQMVFLCVFNALFEWFLMCSFQTQPFATKNGYG